MSKAIQNPREPPTLRARGRRALVSFFNRRRRRQSPRFHHGDWPRSTQTGIRRKSDSIRPVRTKSSLESLRALLSDTLQYTDLIHTNERLLANHRESLATKQWNQPPLQFLNDIKTREAMEIGAVALDAVQTAQRDIEAQEPELLRILNDLAGDNKTVPITPTFNTQARDLLAALISGGGNKALLDVLSEDLRVREFRLGQIRAHIPSRGRGWFWNQRLFPNNVPDLRRNVESLPKLDKSCRALIEERRDALLKNQITRDWAQRQIPAARLAAAERYAKNIKVMLQQKRLMIEWRRSTRSHIEGQALAAGKSFEDHFLDTMKKAVQNVAAGEKNFINARRAAMREGAALQEVPYEWDDDPISEIAWTLPGDMHSGSEKEGVRASKLRDLNRQGVEAWIQLPYGAIEAFSNGEHCMSGRLRNAGSHAPFLNHETPPVCPSIVTQWSGSSMASRPSVSLQVVDGATDQMLRISIIDGLLPRIVALM